MLAVNALLGGVTAGCTVVEYSMTVWPAAGDDRPRAHSLTAVRHRPSTSAPEGTGG